MRVPKIVRGVMRMVETGDSTILISPNGTRHHLGINNDGSMLTTSGTVYNETLVVGVGGIATGTALTLPNAGDYLGEELEIKLNAVVMVVGVDYQYIGTGVKTQIEFTFDLVENDSIVFTKVV